MTQRERSLVLVFGAVGAFAVLFGGFIIVNKALGGLRDKDNQISSLENEIRGSEVRVLQLAKKQSSYDRWRTISLPADQALANTRYRTFLSELARNHNFHLKSITDGGHLRTASSRTTKELSPLAYTVQMEGTLAKLVGFLRDFYAINLPHMIRDMTLVRIPNDSEGRLDVTLKIEALSLPNAPNRDFLAAAPGYPVLAIEVITVLKGGPAGLALGPWLATPTGIHGAQKLAARMNASRDYTRLVAKNVFVGLAPPGDASTQEGPPPDKDVLKFVQLTSITANFLATEATLYNRVSGKFWTVRAEGGFDAFEIHDANSNLILKATVRAVTDRDVVFKVGDKHHGLHIGAFLKDALEKELSAEELKKLGVGPSDPQTVAEEKEKAGEP